MRVELKKKTEIFWLLETLQKEEVVVLWLLVLGDFWRGKLRELRDESRSSLRGR